MLAWTFCSIADISSSLLPRPVATTKPPNIWISCRNYNFYHSWISLDKLDKHARLVGREFKPLQVTKMVLQICLQNDLCYLSLSLPTIKNKEEPTFANDPKQGKTEAPAPLKRSKLLGFVIPNLQAWAWTGARAEASCVRLGFRKGNLTKVKRATFKTIKCISPRMQSSFLNRQLILSVSYRMQFQLGDIGRKVQTWRIGSLSATWGTSQHPAARLFHRIHSFSTHSYFFKCTFRVLQVTSRMWFKPTHHDKKQILELLNSSTTPTECLRSVGTTSPSVEFLSAIDRETRTGLLDGNVTNYNDHFTSSFRRLRRINMQSQTKMSKSLTQAPFRQI